MIYERQFKAILAQEILRFLLRGRLPNLDEISKRISDALGKDGKVTYQYISQPERAVFQVKTYNKALNRIKFDIDIFQEELMDLFQGINKRISYADLYHKVNNYELNRLKSLLEAALFTIENADFYFLSAFDNFIDSSIIDSTLSSPGVLNLSEKCLNIPVGKTATKKIKTSHLHSYGSWPVTIVEPSTENLISSQIIPGTSFSSMFIDTLSAWALEVKTKSQSKVVIRFVFPLAGAAAEEVEVLINKIEILSHATGQHITVRTSTDNVNFSAPLGYEDGISLKDLDTTYSLDFETTLVQYLEITLKKDSPDAELIEQGKKVYQYIFGLKSLASFSIGRGLSASYYSKPFDFSDQDGKISRVSLKSNYIKPIGTNISYYIGLVIGDEVSYLPVNPIGKPTRDGLPEVASFSEVASNSNRFQVDLTGSSSAQQYGSSFQGKTFYRIGPVIQPKPVFGSVKLFRGFRQWYRDTSRTFETINNSDVYINFASSDNEALYTLAKEVPTYENRTNSSSNTRISILSTSKLPYYDSTKGHALKPNSNIDPSTDIRPNYVIYKVLQNNNSSRVTKQFLLGSVRSFFLPATNFVIQSLDTSTLPVLQTTTGVIYRNGIDYVIETSDENGITKPTGRMLLPDGSGLLDSSGNIITSTLLLSFIYTVDPDITHKVSSINGNQITLNNSVIAAEDSLEISYRFIPTSPNEIIQASIRVSNLPSSGTRTFYVEGTDYFIDSRTGVIQRIGSGGIPQNGSVYIDFKHKNSISGINTFIIWAQISTPDGVRINFDLNPTTKKNKLAVDTEAGETFYVSGPGGIVDISRAISTPAIGPGWVQFIVRSKDPDTNIVYGSNLIDQVIQLRDSLKHKVFKEGNIYFDQLVAFREPMVQKTLNHLRVNALASNHQFFAIDDFTDPQNNYIVINYNPNFTYEVYSRVPSEDSDETARPPKDGEMYLVTWNSKNQNIDSSGNKIIVRIDLERKSSTDGALSPKIFGYQLRVST